MRAWSPMPTSRNFVRSPAGEPVGMRAGRHGILTLLTVHDYTTAAKLLADRSVAMTAARSPVNWT